MTSSVIQWVVVILIAVASVEGSIDRAGAGHPHGDDSNHEIADFDPHHHLTTDDAEQVDPHCEHCCHGHTFGFVNPQEEYLAEPRSSAHHCYQFHIGTRAYAPPTPPPTA